MPTPKAFVRYNSSSHVEMKSPYCARTYGCETTTEGRWVYNHKVQQSEFSLAFIVKATQVTEGACKVEKVSLKKPDPRLAGRRIDR